MINPFALATEQLSSVIMAVGMMQETGSPATYILQGYRTVDWQWIRNNLPLLSDECL
jgi:hypothetical protein